MSANHNSYTNEIKKETVEEAKGKNLAQFCRQNELELRMVRRWIQKYEQIAYRCESGDGKKQSTGSGRQTVNVDLENAVYEWIIDRRSRSLAVHRVDIQRMALEINKENDDSQFFKASNHWVDNFMSRITFHCVVLLRFSNWRNIKS